MSRDPAVRVDRVSKEFRLGGTAHLGLKNLLLRSPETRHPLQRRVRFEALRDVSFEIPHGEWVAMIGLVETSMTSQKPSSLR